MISASGKKNRLRMKYPRKLWPLRPATRAGQKAKATQMMKNSRPPATQPPVDIASTPDIGQASVLEISRYSHAGAADASPAVRRRAGDGGRRAAAREHDAVVRLRRVDTHARVST